MAFVALGPDVCQSRGRAAQKFRVDFFGVNLFCDSINWLGFGIVYGAGDLFLSLSISLYLTLSVELDHFAAVRGRSVLFKRLAIQWKKLKTNLLGYLFFCMSPLPLDGS